MLKRFTLHGYQNHSGNTTSSKSPPIFADSYWQWYLESYLQNDKATTIKHTAYSLTKFTDKSPQVITIKSYFESQKLPVPSSTQIIAILKSPLTGEDLNKTYYILRMFQLSSEGLFLTNSRIDKLGNNLKFVGAENWDNVMCYMDALFFAMFANLESFEPILFIPNHNDKLINQLSALMRVYVSLLRSGYLITTDLTARICEGLMKLGFAEALSHKQQDAAVLFEFLTESLNMPLLTFKVDIKHGGKFNKKDDEKFSKERMLFVSIPGDDDNNTILAQEKNYAVAHVENKNGNSGSSIKSDENDNENNNEIDNGNEPEEILLEECLEHYFNNSISVKRELERRASLNQVPTSSNFANIPEDSQVEVLEERPNKPSFEQVEDVDEIVKSNDSSDTISKTEPTRVSVRTRSSTLSIWSLNDNSSNSNDINGKNDKKIDSPKIREVNLPAWMFLRLLPFYTDDNIMSSEFESIAKSSKDFAHRRPVLPICLKRYQFHSGDASGARSRKRIIIPPFIDLPDFVADDVDGPSCSFRLILESAVCHRGNSISSGHFVSVVRKNIKRVDQTEEEAESATWYLYDDMKKTSRVVEKTFKDIFSTEWPYILFYRLVSTNDDSGVSSMKSGITPLNGFKAQYWGGQGQGQGQGQGPTQSQTQSQNFANSKPEKLTLSPILSAETETTIEIPKRKSSKKQKQANEDPVSSLSPNDPKFVDLRKQFYWFFTDDSKNYYKEEPMSFKDGQSQISLSPQFRRNSQLSNLSNMSNYQLDQTLSSGPSNTSVYETAGHHVNPSNVPTLSTTTSTQAPTTYMEPPPSFPDRHSSSSREGSSSPSIWKKAMKRSPNVRLDSSESVGELHKLVSPMNLNETNDTNKEDSRKSTLPHTLRTLQDEQKKHHHLFHRSKNRREAYKKEKCVLM